MDRFLAQFCICLLSVGSLLLPTIDFAVTVSDLNSATVVVDNVSAPARRVAFSQALAQSLVKMSGNSKIMGSPAVRALSRKNGLQLVQSYQYIKDSTGDAPLVFLQVTFDYSGLQQLLQQAQQAVWPKDRPRVLLYFVTQPAEATPFLAAPESNSQQEAGEMSKIPAIGEGWGSQMVGLEPVLQRVAQQRGLPIVLPLMDETDQASWDMQSNRFNTESLTTLMQRYDASIVLEGSIQQTPSQSWLGAWCLFMDGASYCWRSAAETQAMLLGQVLNEAADRIASQYAISNAQAATVDVRLAIQRVANLEQYKQALDAVQHLVPVLSARVVAISGSDLLLQVVAIRGAESLAQALSIDHRFSDVRHNTLSDLLKHRKNIRREESLQCSWAGNTVANAND